VTGVALRGKHECPDRRHGAGENQLRTLLPTAPGRDQQNRQHQKAQRRDAITGNAERVHAADLNARLFSIR
jgi:hypothetical protein